MTESEATTTMKKRVSRRKLSKRVKTPKAKIRGSLRNAVWKHYMGSVTEGRCMCCNLEPISSANFDCGHIVAESLGGDTDLYNLRPICRLCNSSMGTKNMIEFMQESKYDTSRILAQPKSFLRKCLYLTSIPLVAGTIYALSYYYYFF